MTLAESPSSVVFAELPVHLTRFVGRDQELGDLARLVSSTRLLTLTGAGGSGKTRLAREVAQRTAASFARLAWVDLAPLTDAGILAQHVADALHAPQRAGMPPLDLLVTTIGDDRVLLVLDNCEHLVSACASLADALLRACPNLRILATSREALGVASETAWLVPPLASADGTQLFIERAREALPSFAIADTTPVLEEICRRLDGIPLAIELAAARVRVLSPEQIAHRLDDAFRLLTGGSRTALPRHRTLRATMEWSFGLLGAREQALLRRLAVFPGSFTLEAAEAVCALPPLEAEDILDGVSALVDRSLVLMEPGDGIARYRLLETVRQYGIERLDEAAERAALERKHAEHFLALMEMVAPTIVGGSPAASSLGPLRAEQDNLRAAMAWAIASTERVEVALRFVGAAYWYWYGLGQFREARQIVDRALALPADGMALLRGRALHTSGLAALAMGEYPRSERDLEAALPLLRAEHDVPNFGVALTMLGAARLFGGDPDGAVVVLDQALGLCRGAPEPDIVAIFARYWRGWAAHAQGDLDLAYELLAADVAVGREFGLATTLAHGLWSLARIELARGDAESAWAHASEALELEIELQDGWGTALALDVIALATAARGRFEDAARMFGGIDAHGRRLAVVLPEQAPAERARAMASLRASLGAQFDTLYEQGGALTTEQVVEMARTEASRHTTEHRIPDVVAHAPAVEHPRLRVRALGPLQVFVGDRLIDASQWGSARPRELLIYLLLHPEGRTKEQVGVAFWPDASTAQLRNSFHVTLHRLRKALGGAEWVTLTGERYRIDPSLVDEFDAADFAGDVTAARRALTRQEPDAAEQLESALARYRGDLLDGEPVGDWHLEERDRLQRLYVDALMALGAHHARNERHARAAETYRRVLARDELHEDAVVAAMRALADAGERAQALRTYQRFAERMRVELDAAPGGAATRLFERLRQATTAA